MSSKEIKLKDKSSLKAQEEKRDDFLANRMLIIMIAATIFIVVMLLTKKNDINFEANFIINALSWVRIATGILLAASLVYYIINRVRGIDEEYKYFGSPVLLCTSAVLFLISMLYTKIQTTGSVVVIIAVVVLYFLFCFYPRDFFWYSVLTCVGAILIYTSSLSVGTVFPTNIIKFALRIAAVAGPAVIAVFLLVIRRNLGVLSIAGKKIRVMHSDYLYYPFFICGGITVAGAALAMLLPASILYSIIAIFAAFLVIAIIYTIRMM